MSVVVVCWWAVGEPPPPLPPLERSMEALGLLVPCGLAVLGRPGTVAEAGYKRSELVAEGQQ